MNYSPTTPRILFYGDSLVYGKVSGENRRFTVNERFTGRLQALFGDKAEILEEGLRGRMLAGENKFFPERDGLAQFGPIIGSHLPVDVLVIFLGTNDCNAGGEVSAERFLGAYTQYLQKLRDWSAFLATSLPKIMLVAPPAIKEAYFDDAMRTVFGRGAAERAGMLPSIIESCARQLGLEYFDSSTVCAPAPGDGIHLDPKNNADLANALYTRLGGFIQ
jgi:lysophospholipase L1-like esterase